MNEELTVYAPGRALTPVMNLGIARARLVEFQKFVEEYMREGVDYGTIPGTPKPTLYKAGADKLCELYGLTDDYEITDRIVDFEQGLFDYEIKCTLSRDGFRVATGLGSCSSFEGKYRWRGRGESRVENDDIATLKNTILKMAKKRAKVDATLSATRSSGMFTQDVGDGEKAAKPPIQQPRRRSDPPPPEPPPYVEDPGYQEYAPVSDQAAPQQGDVISEKQSKFLWAKALNPVDGGRGALTKDQTTALVCACGYASVKDIGKNDFNRVLGIIERGAM